MKQYDNVVYIGRFQIFHNAHLATIKRAAQLAKRVIVVVGSANQPRDELNPFTQAERIFVISKACEGIDCDIRFVSVENSVYNDTVWANSVASAVEENVTNGESVKLIGHAKDESSYYLKMFPQWGDPIEMPLVEVLDASTIRNMYFSDRCNMNFFLNVVPPATLKWLEEFKDTQDYQNIVEEAVYTTNYRKPYESLPYEPTFNTGDAVVFKSGHVLMIARKSRPGKGLLALPGGFLNASKDASLRDCAIRELREETKIKVPEAVLYGSIREEKIFDAINRSRRGRIITTAQHIVLSEDFPGLPKVKGSDDAAKAMWIPIHKVKRVDCFEDHYDILRFFAGRV